MARVVLTLRPWRAGDEDAFEPRADFAEEAKANGWDWRQGPPGPTWTMVDGDQVLGLGGAVQGEGGAWIAWATLCDLRARQWPEAIRLARKVIDHLLKRGDVRWLWAQCRADFPAAMGVLHKLGFSPHALEHVEALGADVVCMLREG